MKPTRSKRLPIYIGCLSLILFFQNCSSSFRSLDPSELASESPKAIEQVYVPVPAQPEIGQPEVEPSPPSSLANPKSKLVFKNLIDVAVPGCFPQESSTSILQKTMQYKEVFSASLGRTVHLRTYVHQPPGWSAEQKRPVVVILHGGGWIGNDPTYWFPLSFYLASHGVVAINFQYRLWGAHQSGPEEGVKDALSAVRWTRKNAAELGIDPEKVLVFGDSAGGHLALSTALVQNLSDENGADSTSTVPQALYTLYPVVSLTQHSVLTMPFSHPEAHGHPQISPLQLLTPTRLLPATVLWQGSADQSSINPTPLARQFCETANAVAGGRRCHYIEYPGAGHAFIEEAIGEGAETRGHYREAAANVMSFLDDLGYVPGEKSQMLSRVASSAEHCRDWTYVRYNAYKINYGYYPLAQSSW